MDVNSYILNLGLSRADISREITDLKVQAIASLLKGGYSWSEEFAKSICVWG